MPFALILQLTVPTLVHAQAAPGQIEEARTRGASAKACNVFSKGKAFGKATGFDLLVLGTLNRIECAAASAAKKYQTVPADQLASLGADARLQIIADPVAPIRWSNGSWHITPPATHVVLLGGKGNDPSSAVQPDSTMTVPAEWGNAVGGKFQGQGIRAWFGSNRVPPGDFTIVVVTGEEEFRYYISSKDRQLIR
jgi:hypothetical protein